MDKKVEILAKNVRYDILDMLQHRGYGHLGGSLSLVELFAVLYGKQMKYDPKNPKWEGRDRVVLSKGHAGPVWYSTLSECGFFDKEKLMTLNDGGTMLPSHPDRTKTPGVDMTTGSLGQGISAAVGMALSAKLGNDNYRTYTLLGDGEIQEGQVWEAAMFAGHKKLDNLVVIIDNNGLQIDGDIEEVCSPYPIDEKFKSFNFHVINIDAHNFDEIKMAFDEARAIKDKPTAIIAKSIKGKGISFMENQACWHGSAPNEEQYELAMKELNEVGEKLCQM